MKQDPQREELTTEPPNNVLRGPEPAWMSDVRAAQARIEAQRRALRPGDSEPEGRPDPPDQAA